MIVLDANLLIYAYDSGSALHTQARLWVERSFSDADAIGLPWQAISAFLRVMTNKRLPGSKFTTEQASQVVDEWLGLPNISPLSPGDQHLALLRRMLVDGQATGSLVSDAVIAALTIESGGELHTTDRDFARFPGLRWKNPLV